MCHKYETCAQGFFASVQSTSGVDARFKRPPRCGDAAYVLQGGSGGRGVDKARVKNHVGKLTKYQTTFNTCTVVWHFEIYGFPSLQVFHTIYFIDVFSVSASDPFAASLESRSQYTAGCPWDVVQGGGTRPFCYS